MPDYRTDFEKEVYDLLADLLDMLNGHKVKPKDYERIMGKMRDMRIKISNKRYSCKSGKHAMACECR